MAKLMECIPNISEGRRMELVEEFADIVRAVPGVTLIDYSSDASHNRSVFTFLGDPEQVKEAAFRFAKHAVEKIDLRVGQILEAKKHPKADKLLIFQVKMGSEVRQIISGVAQSFKPEDCVGQKVVLVANLKPRKLRGEESFGMLLFGENGERLEFVETKAPDGETVG